MQVSGSSAQAIAGAPPTASSTDDLAGDLYAVVTFMHRTCNADLLEALGELELTLTQIKLLAYLEDAEEEITLKQAAELVHVSLPGASRMVDDLVRRGFVLRQEDVADRRMKRITLTNEGRRVSRRLNDARLSGLREFIHSLSLTERESLSAAVSTLLAREDIAACRPEGPNA